METDDIERLDLIIEALRSELNTMAQSYKLTDPLIISLSQRIDFYLNIRMKILSNHKQLITQDNRF